MRQRLDITDVEAQTKIRAKYLRALENEDFGMLPGSTFVKSFLRTYAEFLGLDPHLLVEEYRARHDPRDESELTPFAPRPRGRERRPPPRAPWLGGALVIGIIQAIVYLLVGLAAGVTLSSGVGGALVLLVLVFLAYAWRDRHALAQRMRAIVRAWMGVGSS